MTKDEIKSVLSECLARHDLTKSEFLFCQEYSTIFQEGEPFLYECLEVLLILSIKEADEKLYFKVLDVMFSLDINKQFEYRVNTEYWTAEYFFSVGEVMTAKEIIEDILSTNNIESLFSNTIRGIHNIAERLEIGIPLKMLDLIKNCDDSWNKIKREFNKAVKRFEKEDYETAKKVFWQLSDNKQVRGRLTQGYCFIYLARIETDKRKKQKMYERAKEVFLIKENRIMCNLVEKEIDQYV